MLPQATQLETLVVADVTPVDAVLAVGVSQPMPIHVAAIRRRVTAQIALVHHRYLLFLHARRRQLLVLFMHVLREHPRRVRRKRADVTLKELFRMRPLVVRVQAHVSQ